MPPSAPASADARLRRQQLQRPEPTSYFGSAAGLSSRRRSLVSRLPRFPAVAGAELPAAGDAERRSGPRWSRRESPSGGVAPTSCRSLSRMVFLTGLGFVTAALAMPTTRALAEPPGSIAELSAVETLPEEWKPEETAEATVIRDSQYRKEALAVDLSREGARLATDRRKAVRDKARRWPDAVIPYDITESAAGISSTARSLIRSAMDYWESQSCVRFVPYNPKTDKDYVVIQRGNWCNSFPGRRGGAQPMNLAFGCLTFGSIVHELGHATGWVHEHTRPDRDKYIKILWNRVHNEEDMKQLRKHSYHVINTYDIPYDYGSIMHYSGIGGTIKTLDPTKQELIGQRKKLSFYDVKLSNIMYKCAERNKCDLITVTCESEGFVGPKCTCVCPDGTNSCTAKKGAS